MAEPIKAWVDAYVKASLAEPEIAAPVKEAPRIVLDLSSVDRVREESNHVRNALIASVGEEQPATEPSEEALVRRPADAPEGLLTDLAPVQRVLKRRDSLWPIALEDLDDEWRVFFEQIHERVSLDALAALLEGPEAFAAYAKEQNDMPDLLLDGINEIAADTIGDLVADADGIYEDYLPEIKKHLIKE